MYVFLLLFGFNGKNTLDEDDLDLGHDFEHTQYLYLPWRTIGGRLADEVQVFQGASISWHNTCRMRCLCASDNADTTFIISSVAFNRNVASLELAAMVTRNII
jgi:hypothetical protein